MEWIRVEDRLPKKHKEVLVFRNDPDCGINNEISISYLSWMLEQMPIWKKEGKK